MSPKIVEAVSIVVELALSRLTNDSLTSNLPLFLRSFGDYGEFFLVLVVTRFLFLISFRSRCFGNARVYWAV